LGQPEIRPRRADRIHGRHRLKPPRLHSGAGIEHARQYDNRAYLGRKPSFTREQFVKVRATLGQ
jgi:hypothetical protein